MLQTLKHFLHLPWSRITNNTSLRLPLVWADLIQGQFCLHCFLYGWRDMTTKPLDQKYAAHLHVPISQFGDMCYKDATTHCFVLTTLAADRQGLWQVVLPRMMEHTNNRFQEPELSLAHAAYFGRVCQHYRRWLMLPDTCIFLRETSTQPRRFAV